MVDSAQRDVPLAADSLQGLGEGRHGPVWRLQGPAGDLVVRWVENVEALLPFFRIWTRVRHPGLVLPCRVGLDSAGRPWIARPFCEGHVLDVASPAGDDPGWPVFVRRWLGALDALHAAGWLHRDVKPANLLVGPAGARLFDLDLAAELDEDAVGGGTRTWMAPEILTGQPADERSDLFGLGASLARVLLGPGMTNFSARFPRDDFWAASGLNAELLPAALSELVRSLTQRDPTRRPASARAAAGLLPGAASMGGSLVPPPLLGRAEGLLELARAHWKSRKCLVVATNDAQDQRDAQLTLAFAAALESRGVHEVDGVLDELAIARAMGETSQGGLVRLDRLANGTVLVEPLASEGSTLFVVCSEEQAEVAQAGLGGRFRELAHWHRLGDVPAEALTGHLQNKVTLSSAAECRDLAADLHRKSRGSQMELETLLARASELGVAREMPDGWALERTRWPVSSMEFDAGPAPLAAARHEGPSPVAHLRIEGWSVDGLTADHEDALGAIEALRLSGRLAVGRVLADEVERLGLARDPRLKWRLEIQRANLDLAQGSLEATVDRLQALLGGRSEDFSDPLQARAAVVLGDVLQRIGRTDDALLLYAAVAEASNDPDQRLRAAVGAAYAVLLSGKPNEVVRRLEGVQTDGASMEARGGFYNLRGGALLRLQRTGEATEEFEQALALGKDSGDVGLVARALLNRAVLERGNGRFAEAESSLKQASASVQHTDLLGVRALVSHNLGTLLRDRGDLERAQRSLGLALRLRRRTGDRYGEATTVASLALLALERGAVGSADQQMRAAHVELLEAGHRGEAALVAQHLRLAEAVLGRSELVDDGGEGSETTSLLGARAQSLEAFFDGARDEAVRVAASAAADSGLIGGPAERFRLVALGHALAFDHVDRERFVSDLQTLARQLGAGRVREATFRTSGSLTVSELRQLSAAFREEGRVDLEWSVSRRLVEQASLKGDARTRRLAARRVSELEEVLTEGVAEALRDQTLSRMAQLTGAAAETVQESAPVQQLDLEWFSSINRQLMASDGLEELLSVVLDRALECTGGRRGLLLVRTPDGLESMSSRGLSAAEADRGDMHLSGSVVRAAMESGSTILTQDVATDPRFRDAASVQFLALRAVLCVPLLGPQGAYGAVYVDDERDGALFDDSDARVLACLAEQAGAVVRQLMAHQEIEQLNSRLKEHAEAQREELVAVRKQLRTSGVSPAIAGMVGESPVMRSMRDQLRALAHTDLPVLITGPSGSGKELVARALHALGPRENSPLVVENMAALASDLVESEFFGHASGAFTGAGSERKGLFEEANGGTLFLDEVADLDLKLQAKLLRVLESGEFRRVGESFSRRADVRLVAATNADMEARVAEKTFRADLYYRLNAAEVRVPSLRQRREDIPLLIDYFLEVLQGRYGKRKALHRRVLTALLQREWPGEVRELRNEVERLYLLSGDQLNDISLVRVPSTQQSPGASAGASAGESFTLEDAERRAIVRALDSTGGNRAEAARLLGVSRAGFYNKLDRHGLGERD